LSDSTEWHFRGELGIERLLLFFCLCQSA
jgi:hypothetical protein